MTTTTDQTDPVVLNTDVAAVVIWRVRQQRAAGVRSESVPKLIDALRHAVSRVTAVTKTLPRRAPDE